MCGANTRAIPLLLAKKKDCYFSRAFVYVKVLPVTDENFWVCSCSSLRMGYPLRLIESLNPVFDLTEAAKRIDLLPFFRPPRLSSLGCDSYSSLRRFFSWSRAIWISDLFCGASCELGTYISDEKLKAVLIPDRFLSTNFYELALLIRQFVKLTIWSFCMLPYASGVSPSVENA